MAKYNILITGGAGFVGSHLTKECIKLGWNVSILYQEEFGLAQVSSIREMIQAYPVHGDIGEIELLMGKVKPDLVIHLASLYITKHQSQDILALLTSNIMFGIQILEAMKANNIRYFINTGTSWQHYQDQPYNPVNLYAATKQAFEDILSFYLESTEDLQAITLKLFDTYGPSDPRPKLLNLLDKAAKDNLKLAMSPGDQLIDLVYIDDVVRAFLVAAGRLLMGKSKKSESFAVSSGSPIKLKDFVALYQQIRESKLEIEWGGLPYREREVMIPWSKGRRLPGWKPEVSLIEGIRKTIEAHQ